MNDKKVLFPHIALGLTRLKLLSASARTLLKKKLVYISKATERQCGYDYGMIHI